MPTNLDDPTVYAHLDPAGIGARFVALPTQLCEGWRLAETADLNALIRRNAEQPRFHRVLVAGMGGSAIGGELIRGLADHTDHAVQIVSWRDYGLPSWVDHDTLVLAVSVSGGTAETRSALATAVEHKIPALAICGPGAMSGEARQRGVPLISLGYRHEPRAGLGFTFATPYRVLQRLNLLPDEVSTFEDAISAIDRVTEPWRPSVPADGNMAKQIALALQGPSPASVDLRLPVVYGARHLSGVAMRWKTQFNENADLLAFWETLPESNHNGIQGVESTATVNAKLFHLLLDSPHYPRELRERVAITKALLEENGRGCRVIEVDVPSTLAEVLTLTVLGDLVSYYLALLLGRDPSSTAQLNAVKARVTA